MPEVNHPAKQRHAAYRWTGLGGVSPHDRPAAHAWKRRLHWPMVLAALLALPAFYSRRCWVAINGIWGRPCPCSSWPPSASSS